MAPRATAPELRLMSSKGANLADRRVRSEAQLGGIPLDWDTLSAGIPEGSYAEAEWERLAEVYESQDDRFYESDRPILEEWCFWRGVRQEAGELLRQEGLMVPGRGHGDQDRSVRNPLLMTASQATKELRALAYHLAFSPEARKRAGVIEKSTGETEPGDDLLSG